MMKKDRSFNIIEILEFWLPYLLLAILILPPAISQFFAHKPNILLYLLLGFLAVFWPFPRKFKMEKIENGWIVGDSNFFRIMTQNEPPRPFRYIDQLKIDIMNWRPVLLWGVGIGCIIMGIRQRQIFIILFGGYILFIFGRMLFNVVENYRGNPLLYGFIHELQGRNPSIKECSVADAFLEDGRKFSITIPTKPTNELIEKYGKVQVAFLYESKAEHSLAIGFRALINAEV